MKTKRYREDAGLILTEEEQSIVQALRSLSSHQVDLFGRSIIQLAYARGWRPSANSGMAKADF